MYRPAHFREERLEVLHDAMRSIALATLITVSEDGPRATHLPLLIDPSAGPYGTLYGHVARANPQWRDMAPAADGQVEGRPALAVFLGPHAYISPRWYATKRETGRVVPTWNYLAVHAHGRPRAFDDPARLREVVERLTDWQEADQPAPWRVADAPEAYLEGMLRGIVGVEMPIERLEGAWKLNQNRTQDDRQGVVAGLGERSRPGDPDLAALMAASLDGSESLPR